MVSFQLPVSDVWGIVCVARWLVVHDEALAAQVRWTGDGNLVFGGGTRELDRRPGRWSNQSGKTGPDASASQCDNSIVNRFRYCFRTTRYSRSAFDARRRRTPRPPS